MYSWKAIRIACAILLLIPIVHLAVLVSQEALAMLDSSPAVWNDELDAYARLDSLSELPTDPIVIVGGRRVLLWKGAEEVMAPQNVLMRGLGDATVNDIIYNYERLIGFYQPEIVVLLPSNSEFHIRDMKDAEELVAGIRELVELDLKHRKNGLFYVYTPINTQLYPGDRAKIEAVSQQLKAWAMTNLQVEILDANAFLSDRNGTAKPDYFRTDGVNLNGLGYSRLSMLLLSQVERDHPDGYSNP